MFLDELEEKARIAFVRTLAGVRKYGQPVGTLIRADGRTPFPNLAVGKSEWGKGWRGILGNDGVNYHVGEDSGAWSVLGPEGWNEPAAVDYAVDDAEAVELLSQRLAQGFDGTVYGSLVPFRTDAEREEMVTEANDVVRETLGKYGKAKSKSYNKTLATEARSLRDDLKRGNYQGMGERLNTIKERVRQLDQAQESVAKRREEERERRAIRARSTEDRERGYHREGNITSVEFNPTLVSARYRARLEEHLNEVDIFNGRRKKRRTYYSSGEFVRAEMVDGKPSLVRQDGTSIRVPKYVMDSAQFASGDYALGNAYKNLRRSHGARMREYTKGMKTFEVWMNADPSRYSEEGDDLLNAQERDLILLDRAQTLDEYRRLQDRLNLRGERMVALRNEREARDARNGGMVRKQIGKYEVGVVEQRNTSTGKVVTVDHNGKRYEVVSRVDATGKGIITVRSEDGTETTATFSVTGDPYKVSGKRKKAVARALSQAIEKEV